LQRRGFRPYQNPYRSFQAAVQHHRPRRSASFFFGASREKFKKSIDLLSVAAGNSEGWFASAPIRRQAYLDWPVDRQAPSGSASVDLKVGGLCTLPEYAIF